MFTSTTTAPFAAVALITVDPDLVEVGELTERLARRLTQFDLGGIASRMTSLRTVTGWLTSWGTVHQAQPEAEADAWVEATADRIERRLGRLVDDRGVIVGPFD